MTVTAMSLHPTRSDRIVPTTTGRFSTLCLHPMEVKGWHFVGCPVAIEREAVGPAQEVDPHGLTERLPMDSMDDF